jgi:hypothetical protein
MKLRAALAFAPLAQGFVPARTTDPRTAVVVRSEPIEINAPTVYSHWSANVNEEVISPASVTFCPRKSILLRAATPCAMPETGRKRRGALK